MDYVDGREPADELMQEIDAEIDIAKRCDEWRRDYMTFALELERYKEYGREEGFAEGMARGETKSKLESISNLMANMHLTAEAAMAALGVAEADYPKYLAALK